MSRFYETRSELGNFATDYHEANNEWTVDQEDYEYEQQKRNWYRQHFNEANSQETYGSNQESDRENYQGRYNDEE